ncbi:MAG: hypothetical protein HXL64_03230, partial [Thermobifida sp.]|nr:hypothetical protein [Thermobifida sp.]
VAIKVDGTPRDLETPFEAGTTVEAITLASEDGLNILRHSATHVLAQAVQDVFPDVIHSGRSADVDGVST